MREIRSLSMSRNGFLGLLLLALCFVAAPASAAFIGSWDLRGSGQLDSVYNEGNVLRVIEVGGRRVDYRFNQTNWALVQVADTNGASGLEMIVRAGNDLVVIEHAIGNQRSYPMGNISWAVMEFANLDNLPGNEVLISIGNGIRVLSDRDRRFRDLRFSYNGSWALFGMADLAGGGLELILNMGNGVKLIDPRAMTYRDVNFSGYSAIFGVAQLDGKVGLEVIGRTSSGIYVIGGGVANATQKTYTISSSEAWAIYGRTADTDGKAGNEIIVVMQNKIRVIRHADGIVRDYSVGNLNYSIDSVSDLDGVPGNEILVRNTAGRVYIINDRMGTVVQQ